MNDDVAFERFVREHTSTLFRTAFLLTGNRNEAEDLLQDTLTRLYPKWDRVVAADKPIAYVQRCVGNRFVSVKRSPAGRVDSGWELPDGWDGTDVGEQVAVSRTVWQLMAGLPQRQRAAVVLRYLYGLPEHEVATALGCRPVSVRSLVSRAVTAMRTAYFAEAAIAEGSR